MSVQLSIRSILLITLTTASGAMFIASPSAASDNLGAIAMLASTLITLISVPAMTASLAFDVCGTRRSAELGAFYGFVVLALAGILLASIPVV